MRDHTDPYLIHFMHQERLKDAQRRQIQAELRQQAKLANDSQPGWSIRLKWLTSHFQQAEHTSIDKEAVTNLPCGKLSPANEPC